MSTLNYSIENFATSTGMCPGITMPSLAESSCAAENIISIADFSTKRAALLLEYTKRFDSAKTVDQKCLLENIIKLIVTNKTEVERWNKEIVTLKATIDRNESLIKQNDKGIQDNEGYKLIKENRLISSGENKNAVNKEFIIYIVLIVLFLVIQICLIVF